ncbi:MAG TPA: hypothetical protein VN628_03230, partial [Vicinamibacterales bacterium]|nr:hypothetical protein [Vicinamibacterales bacterium]
FRDPRVGRDVLVGLTAGVVLGVLRLGVKLLPPLLGYAPPPPHPFNTQLLLSSRRALATVLTIPPDALFTGLIATLAFALARMVVKRTWAALVISIVVGAFLYANLAATEQFSINEGFALVFAGVMMAVLVRFGMFALIMASLAELVIRQGGLTADLSKLYAPTSVWLMLLIAALAAFGYYASRGDEPLFGRFET